MNKRSFSDNLGWQNKITKDLSLISCCIAAGVSYAINKSFWWALLHFVLGYIYLAYQAALYFMK